tara:strand:+ start:26 stop:1456 length:1431 start_codon:yes stop_codon:yes gene_type:complete
LKIVLTIILATYNLVAQEVPQDFLSYLIHHDKLDHGKGWEVHTTFGPLRYQQLTPKENVYDTLNVKYRIGFNGETIDFKNNATIYGELNYTFKKYFYGFLYYRIVSDPNEKARYSGIPRDISRFGFSSGETDLSGMGYENEWILLQFGRGRQSWGAGKNIILAFSDMSAPYEYGMLGLKINKFRYRFVNGFLETYNNSQRYLSARGLEYKNNESLFFSLSEIVIYSGKNRSVDIAYLNPVSTHLEIELNDKQNRIGTDSGNAVWQASVDFIAKNKFRLSGNFLVDEFAIDKSERDMGKDHGLAYSIRTVYILPALNIKNILPFNHSFSLSYIKVNTNTFRHERVSDIITGEITGYNNFVHRGDPLGWEYGSDGEEVKLGYNFSDHRLFLGSLNIGSRKIGSNSIIFNPYQYYTEYTKGPFPSGTVNKTNFLSGQFKLKWKNYLNIYADIEYCSSNIFDDNYQVKIGFDFFITNRVL